MNTCHLSSILAALLVVGCASSSHDSTPVELENCAIQTTIPGAKATGAFLNIHKHDNRPLSLVSAKIPTVTKHVEIHTMEMKNGTMMMKEIKELPLNKGDNLLQKGGYHVMLMDLKKPLAVGDTHQLTLTFSDGQSATCQAAVKTVKALTPKSMKHTH